MVLVLKYSSRLSTCSRIPNQPTVHLHTLALHHPRKMVRTTMKLLLFALLTFSLTMSISGGGVKGGVEAAAVPLTTSLRRQASYLYETSSALYSSSSEAFSARFHTAYDTSRLRMKQAADTLSHSMHQAAVSARTAFGLDSSADSKAQADECVEELCSAHH